MSGLTDYDKYDGLGLAELVRSGQVSPRELCREAMARIERLNPGLNAVVTTMYDQALAAAQGEISGPFAGTPLLVKDLGFDCAGVPTTSGSKALAGFIPDHDSEMVVRLKRAGFIILGKTNTPEFGLMAVTEPELFGPCHNPWNRELTPGGSSGGSASAVAAGLTPLAGGGDGGGSIRIPSAHCGLVGLKPSRGRNPTGPDHGRVWQGAVQEHVLTRSVRDSAAVLDAVSGPDVGAPYDIRPPEQAFLSQVGADPGQLRIAFNTASPLDRPVDPECVRAVEEAARLLESLGHKVEEARPDINGLELAGAYMTMYFGEMAADIEGLSQVLGRKAKPADVEPITWTLGLLGRTFSAGYFVKAMRIWDSAARRMGRFFQAHDLYLTPTTASLPVRVGELKPSAAETGLMKVVNSLGLGGLLKASGMVDKLAQKSLEKTPFTQLANLTGLPALSLPLHWTDAGLPVGVQFIAPLGEEARLFRLAGQLEAARPWFERRPPQEGD